MSLHLDQKCIDSICLPFFASIKENQFKVCLTRGGNVAIVLNMTAGGWNPLLGVYFTGTSLEDGEWIPVRWCSDGTFKGINDKVRSKLDLIMPRDENLVA